MLNWHFGLYNLASSAYQNILLLLFSWPNFHTVYWNTWGWVVGFVTLNSSFFHFSQIFSHDLSEYSDDTGTQASVVSIVDWMFWDLIHGMAKRFYCFPKFPDGLLGPPSILINGYEGCFPLDIMGRLGSWLLPSRAEVKNEWACSSPVLECI